jgi:hypothetical protein
MNTADGELNGEGETVSLRLNALMQEQHLNANTLAKKVPDGPDRVTITRILTDPDHCPRISSLEPIEAYFKRPGYLTEVLERPAGDSHPYRPDHRLIGIWYEHIPKQPGRDYESIDYIDLRRNRNGEYRARIKRLLSTRNPTDVGEEWEAVGRASEERFLYLVFYSVSDNRPDSNGSLAVRRDQSYRRLDGGYLRFREDDSPKRSGPPLFKINWHRDASGAVEKSVWSVEEVPQSGKQ